RGRHPARALLRRGEPAPKTDILVLKVSAAGDVEWEARVDIAAYDQPDVLIEYPGGYALAVTEYGREGGSTAHILTYGDRGDARDRLAIKAGFGRVTALVPADGGGEFLAATERPESSGSVPGGARCSGNGRRRRRPGGDGARLPPRSGRSLRRGVGG
ncbi:hypothetical protein, partial [Methanoculleus chikugoensis]|uniref:hypothetical protein n=1 Tax=Methanoculleus chikugoensis TaxID=118126 RepID=UPI000B0E6B3F